MYSFAACAHAQPMSFSSMQADGSRHSRSTFGVHTVVQAHISKGGICTAQKDLISSGRAVTDLQSSCLQGWGALCVELLLLHLGLHILLWLRLTWIKPCLFDSALRCAEWRSLRSVVNCSTLCRTQNYMGSEHVAMQQAYILNHGALGHSPVCCRSTAQVRCIWDVHTCNSKPQPRWQAVAHLTSPPSRLHPSLPTSFSSGLSFPSAGRDCVSRTLC